MIDDRESEQLALSRQLLDESQKRTKLAAERSEMSMQRSYMNAERTLSVWVRTALAMMISGIAIDRFDLLLHQFPAKTSGLHSLLKTLSSWCGVALVALGVLLAAVISIRFIAYDMMFRREHEAPPYHGPWLAPSVAALTAIFGLILLIVMCVYAE